MKVLGVLPREKIGRILNQIFSFFDSGSLRHGIDFRVSLNHPPVGLSKSWRKGKCTDVSSSNVEGYPSLGNETDIISYRSPVLTPDPSVTLRRRRHGRHTGVCLVFEI